MTSSPIQVRWHEPWVNDFLASDLPMRNFMANVAN